MTEPKDDEEPREIIHYGGPRSASETGFQPFMIAGAVATAVAATFLFAFRPDGLLGIDPFIGVAASYLVLTVITLAYLRARVELTMLRPKSGDVSIGAVVAGLLFLFAYVGAILITPHGSEREAWLMRVYVLFGDPFADSRHVVGVLAAAIGMMEEITWRGLVYGQLERRLGGLRAVLATSFLFGIAHLPTLFLFGDPVAGPNPLLVVAALGCGFVWGYLRFRLDRLFPVIISHGLFTWAIIEFPLWRN